MKNKGIIHQSVKKSVKHITVLNNNKIANKCECHSFACGTDL